jgi:hypothetical protein
MTRIVDDLTGGAFEIPATPPIPFFHPDQLTSSLQPQLHVGLIPFRTTLTYNCS